MDQTEPTTPPAPQPSQPTQPSQPARTKPWLVPLTIILVVVAIAVGAWMYYSNTRSQTEAQNPTAAVTITDGGFTPATIKIQKGQDVTWTNQSQKSVQITGDQKSTGLKSSEGIAPGESYSFTFDDSGTYYYHQSGDLSHTGVVVVE